ncbi:hypothetical protein, partial [Actinoplanes philippinensis]|uniref:hypothetical protein n=1 Tax=Actinoplanes philippinensis TaxID=35752 RepID=UPI0033E943F9
MTTALGPLARCLHDTIRSHRTARIPLDELRRAAHSADLSLAGDPGGRRRLADAIDQLVTAGLLRLPVKRDAWDNTIQPPLPTWVQRPAVTRPARPATAPVTTAWHARLAWAATFIESERPSTAELALLHAANRFLAENSPPPVVAMRERSWELLRDEKALDTLSRGRLFARHRLKLSDLYCRRVPLPIAQWEIGEGPAALLVENHTTAHTLAQWLPADGQVGVVIYSGGSQLPQMLASLPDGWASPLYYYGDL